MSNPQDTVFVQRSLIAVRPALQALARNVEVQVSQIDGQHGVRVVVPDEANRTVFMQRLQEQQECHSVIGQFASRTLINVVTRDELKAA